MDRCAMSRRGFLKRATWGAAGALASPIVLPSSIFCANGTVAPSHCITLGLIGAGNINTRHREALLAEPDARIVAVCDPVMSRRQTFRDRINAAAGGEICADYRDFRELLARPDIDAVCIGTPDHWHAAHAISAMQAGKDVYVEKPLTLTVAEGRRVLEVASERGRILQTGLQRRSMGSYRRACELVRNGRIGRLTHAEVGILSINVGVQAGRNFPERPVPEGFDYDLWLGPAPMSPFSWERVARGNEICYWYYIFDYTVGFVSGNGIHFVDIAQWGIGDDVKPVRVRPISADIPVDGLVDDAIAWQAEVVYDNGVLMSYSSQDNPHPDGIRFVGTEGWVHVDGGGGLRASSPDILQSRIEPGEVHLLAAEGHHRNFLDCIKTRRQAAASPEIGHHATTTCNLVDVALRLGRPLTWDAMTERFVGDEAANSFLSRSMRPPWGI